MEEETRRGIQWKEERSEDFSDFDDAEEREMIKWVYKRKGMK